MTGSNSRYALFTAFAMGAMGAMGVACGGSNANLDQNPSKDPGQPNDLDGGADSGARDGGPNGPGASEDGGTITVEPYEGIPLAVGWEHACAVADTGKLRCWGRNTYKQTPNELGWGPIFRSVAVSERHTCGKLGDGPYCFGADNAGTSYPPISLWSISVGTLETCAVLREEGAIQCWGPQPMTPPAGSFVAVSVGSHYDCALRANGSLTCWGEDAYRYNVSGTGESRPGPYRAVSVGWNHVCALRADGHLECWGQTSEGATSAPGGTFKSVSAGLKHTCAIRADDTVDCWGDITSPPPTGKFRHVSAGVGAAAAVVTDCAVAIDGKVTCWGEQNAIVSGVPADLVVAL